MHIEGGRNRESFPSSKKLIVNSTFILIRNSYQLFWIYRHRAENSMSQQNGKNFTIQDSVSLSAGNNLIFWTTDIRTHHLIEPSSYKCLYNLNLSNVSPRLFLLTLGLRRQSKTNLLPWSLHISYKQKRYINYHNNLIHCHITTSLNTVLKCLHIDDWIWLKV